MKTNCLGAIMVGASARLAFVCSRPALDAKVRAASGSVCKLQNGGKTMKKKKKRS